MQPGAGDDAITSNSRGILDPGRMRDRVDFVRIQPTAALAEFVDFLWAVQWSMPDGEEFVQPVLSHPTANLSVGAASSRGLDDDRIEATAVGVVTGVDRRRLRGASWNVAAKLRPGALGVFVTGDAASFTDRIVPLAAAVALDGDVLVAEMTSLAGKVASQVGVLAAALEGALAAVPARRRAAASEATGIGGRIETDRTVRSVAMLAAAVGYSERSLQRMFREHAGISPLSMIRRYRLIEAADAARDGSPPSWAHLADELGYADQAHLSRDFKAVVGLSPAAYAESVTPVTSARRPTGRAADAQLGRYV